MGGPLCHAPGEAALRDELAALQGRPGLSRGGPPREGARGARPAAPVGAGTRRPPPAAHRGRGRAARLGGRGDRPLQADRKSTRLNSSHVKISYAVFCLKKKKKI